MANWYDAGGRLDWIKRQLKQIAPDLIGLSILNANRWGGIEIARAAKEIFPDIPVIFGGPGATFLWRHLLQHFSCIDFIILGEGEESFIELVQALESERDPSALPGLALRKQGQAVKTRDRGFIEDLDSLSDPAQFFTFQHVISSRGCPWNCTFCGSPSIWKRRVRFHSPDYFVSQLKRLKKKGANFFFVSDDTFTLKKDRVIEICQEIIAQKLDITWQAISRVNHVDQEVLTWMRRAGCTQISYGIESGSAKIRKRLNKDLPAAKIRQAFRETASAGMLPRAYFIYGSPGETDKTVGQTIALMDEIGPLAAIFYIMDIFPGTALYEDFKKRTRATDDIWLKRIEDIMYFETDPRMSREKILEWGRRLRGHFYRRLPDYVRGIRLMEDESMRHLHADFLSRLAMTFAFGEYAAQDEIPGRIELAMELFQKSLEYAPDHRAFLGLAIMEQKQGRHRRALEVTAEGLDHFPDSEELSTCMAVSLMNLGNFKKALEILLRFDNSVRCLQYALQCAQALKDMALYQDIAGRLEALAEKDRTDT